MSYPTYDEWLATLEPAQRAKALDLAEQFKALGAQDPTAWARSEVSENIAQLTRFLFLKDIWQNQIDSWTRDPQTWIRRSIDGARSDPKGYFADAGIALERAKALGVSDADIAAIARKIAYEVTFDLLDQIDESFPRVAQEGSPGWHLMEIDSSGNLTGRDVAGLHEDILTMDPSGREGRPA